MKRILAMLLVLAMMLGIGTCCAQEEPEWNILYFLEYKEYSVLTDSVIDAMNVFVEQINNKVDAGTPLLDDEVKLYYEYALVIFHLKNASTLQNKLTCGADTLFNTYLESSELILDGMKLNYELWLNAEGQEKEYFTDEWLISLLRFQVQSMVDPESVINK